MSALDDILQFNGQFVRSGEYKQFSTDKFPEKQLAILSCMDARTLDLLPRALGLKNGDAKLIRNAGAVVTHPWGSVMRSLLIAVLELNVREIMVIAHHDCGMRGLNSADMLAKIRASGVSEECLNTLQYAGIDLDRWLTGFDNVEDSVRYSVQMIRQHPLMPNYVAVHGLVIHPETGQLTLVTNGFELMNTAS